MGDAEYVAKQHIYVGPIFFLFEYFSNVRAENLVLDKLPVGVLGMGVPRLACLRPAAWLKGGPAQPTFINTDPRPLRGAKPRGADDMELPQARPHQDGSQGGGEIKAGYLTRCP